MISKELAPRFTGSWQVVTAQDICYKREGGYYFLGAALVACAHGGFSLASIALETGGAYGPMVNLFAALFEGFLF